MAVWIKSDNGSAYHSHPMCWLVRSLGHSNCQIFAVCSKVEPVFVAIAQSAHMKCTLEVPKHGGLSKFVRGCSSMACYLSKASFN